MDDPIRQRIPLGRDRDKAGLSMSLFQLLSECFGGPNEARRFRADELLYGRITLEQFYGDPAGRIFQLQSFRLDQAAQLVRIRFDIASVRDRPPLRGALGDLDGLLDQLADTLAGRRDGGDHGSPQYFLELSTVDRYPLVLRD